MSLRVLPARPAAVTPGGSGRMLRLLGHFLRPYWRALVLVVSLLLVQSLANLYLPELYADIINNGVSRGDTGYIMRIGALMLAVTAALGVASIIAVYWAAKTAMAFGRDLRAAIFSQVQAFSQVEVNHFGTASLITRNTNDVQQVQTVVLIGLTVMVSAPIMLVGGVIMALRQDVPLTAILLVIVPLMALIIGTLVRRAMPLFRTMQVRIDRINQVMRETLAGVRVIRAFVRTDYEERRFDAANTDLFATSLSVNRLFALMMPALMAIMNLSTVAVLWFGAIRVDSGQMPIGNLTAFLQYIIQILFAIMMATFMFVIVPRAAVSSDRIGQVLDTEPSIHDPAEPLRPPRQGLVEFRDVEFRYPGAEEPVLRHISFAAGPGETTAIVGSTGSGKSTLINLLPRFYDVSAGTVLVDGVDVRALERADLWGRIGLIPQHAFLFAGTVASNLRYGDETAADADLWAALEIAQAQDFVTEMEGGLAAPIAAGGTNVSGGQRQRLAIARALVKKPDVYVFDDSFSALDFRTDARLRAALADNLAGATVIIVAQRVGTILHADRIVVLEAGGVVGIGTHAELMASCQTYREIVYSQLSAEELA
jgi:ATP-binding cassette subfamily B protein